MSDAPTSIKLPQVDRILREPILIELSETIRRDILAELVREDLSRLREELKDRNQGSQKQKTETAETVEEDSDEYNDLGDAARSEVVARRVARIAKNLLGGGVRRVINGTGVILNTNLGRAPLPLATLDRLRELGQGYTSLEIEVATGKRGERTAMISRLLSLLTGCQSAIVVNNNASAVMLAVSALARGKEVVVSRGELIEIGGSFRLPDVVTAAGGILKEVGTTNRTRAADFKSAINPNTGLMLRCHRSNFEITGFTEEAEVSELVAIAHAVDVPLAEDLGSGALFDIARFGLTHEPTVDEVIKSGVGIVMFSGDKLLGGPQAGIIAGRKELVSKLRKDPMYRALRADKLIIALLEIVLAQYLSPQPEQCVPVISLASQSTDDLRKRVDSMVQKLNDNHFETKSGLSLSLTESQSALGGGSLPGKTLPSFALAISSQKNSRSVDDIARCLRNAEPTVISIIHDQRVLIDFRTVLLRDEPDLFNALMSLATS